jgi:hypothetical protein
MTTYTEIDDGQQAEISLSGSHTISDINPMIYGGFTEFVPPSPLCDLEPHGQVAQPRSASV